jgi:hypothetical protein
VVEWRSEAVAQWSRSTHPVRAVSVSLVGVAVLRVTARHVPLQDLVLQVAAHRTVQSDLDQCRV